MGGLQTRAEWRLPAANMPMVFQGKSPTELARQRTHAEFAAKMREWADKGAAIPE